MRSAVVVAGLLALAGVGLGAGGSESAAFPQFKEPGPIAEQDVIAWGVELRLTTDTLEDQTSEPGQKAIVAAPDGRIHAIWWANYGTGSPYPIYQVKYKRYNPSTGFWTSDTLLSGYLRDTCRSQHPAMAIAPSGNLHAVWAAGHPYADNYIVYQRCTPTGNGNGGWETQVMTISTSGFDPKKGHPDIAVTPNGHIHVVWYEEDNFNFCRIMYRRSTNGGNNWLPVEYVVDNVWSYRVSGPSIAAGSDNSVHVAWCGLANGGVVEHVWYRRRDASGSWGPTEQVSVTSYHQHEPWVVCDPTNGNPHVIWYGRCVTTGGQTKVYHRYKSGGAWQPQVTVSEDGGSEEPRWMRRQRCPSMVFRPDGTGHAVWNGYTSTRQMNDQIRYCEWSPTSGWGTIENLTDLDANDRWWPKLANRGDTLHLLWCDERHGTADETELYYRRGVGPYSYPAVQLVVPNGGEYWPGGTQQTIQCTHIGGAPATHDSVLYSTNSGASWIFQFKRAAQNTHVWDVPTTYTTNARVKILALNIAGAVADQSDADFTIYGPPEVTLNVPNGGEYWAQGTVQTIECPHTGWAATEDSVLYSTNSGASWIFQFKEPAAETHSWTVPSTPCLTARVKVVAINGAGTDSDESDADFTICGVPSVHVEVPNGGEVWPASSVQKIRCTHPTWPADRDSIFYSTDGGSTWWLQLNEPAADSHFWMVPFTPTTHARIRICAVNEAGIGMDVSDGDFTITAPGNQDMAVKQIVAPVGFRDTGALVEPQARFRNEGTGQAGLFRAWVVMYDPTDVEVYRESLDYGPLGPGEEVVLAFDTFRLSNEKGFWVTRCSLYFAGDNNPSNDTVRGSFRVGIGPGWPEGWHEVLVNGLSAVPDHPSTKPVKQGGWLAYQGTTDQEPVIFVHKGYKTTDFYAYYPFGDSFRTLRGMPYSTHPNEKWARKAPYKGCKGVQAGDAIYVTQGNNTLGFWSYHPDGDSWHVENDVPAGPDRKKVKGGTDLAYVPGINGGPDCVYLLKGYRTEFYRFDLEVKDWDEALENIPRGSRAKVDKGSWIVYNRGETGGEHLVYAFKAKYNELHAYHIDGDSFTTLEPMPFEGWHSGKRKNKKSKDGGCGSYSSGHLFALKGGNTQQFWKYFPAGDTWHELETLPNNGSTGKKKRVKYGGDMVCFDDYAFFALKGNKTRELWRYIEPFQPAGCQGRDGVTGVAAAGLAGVTVELAPNPLAGRGAVLRYSLAQAGPAIVRVYDACGRVRLRKSLVANRSGTVGLDLRGLSPGVYLVRFDAGEARTVRKMVIQD